MKLQERIMQAAAELGDLHLRVRGLERDLGAVRAAIAAKEAQIDALVAVRNDELAAAARAAAELAKEPPPLPDLPRQPDLRDAVMDTARPPRCHAECCDETCTCGHCNTAPRGAGAGAAADGLNP